MSTYAGKHGSTGTAAPGEELNDGVVAELLGVARAWQQDDPDPATRTEIASLIERAEAGDGTSRAELADRFSGMLAFGTAGLRGELGAGPQRMNRAVVIRAAAGLTAYLKERMAEEGDENGPMVVIGFDARHNSDVFARDTAAVVVAAGGRAAVLPHPLPTPVLAFAIRHLGADAGVMVTASHNPSQDNGYKVYLGDGCQIVSPVDREISRQIERVSAVADVPLADDGWETLGDDVVDAYLDAVTGVVGTDTPREVSVVHTALHGVGSETVVAAFSRAGFPEPEVVPSQAQPDPEFPTVAFPNPEEPGAVDAALEAARASTPDLVIANDPDADRCAVIVPDSAAEGGWRLLRGDDVGALLGSHIIFGGVPKGACFASSIVSSRLLGAMCAQSGVRHVETLTGFKWIARTEGLRYGYEEALGYCVAPDVVRDKDGISAALLIAELAAILKKEGRTLLDVLDDLHTQHGVHATDAYAVRVDDLDAIGTVMGRLREDPPTTIAGESVTSAEDLAEGVDGLPPTEGLRYLLADGTRITVRPSGTEPKLKVYLEAVEPVTNRDSLGDAREETAQRLSEVRTAMEALTAAE